MAADAHAARFVALLDVARAAGASHELAALVRHDGVDGHHLVAQRVTDSLAQRVQPLAGDGADERARRAVGRGARIGREQVDLVVDGDPRLGAGPQLVEHRLHGHLLGHEVGIGGIDDLEQQIGAHHLLERGAEGVDEVVRQLVDEADRIGHDDGTARGKRHLAARRVEGGEEHVGGVDVRIGQGVEERALAGVGIANERDGRDLVAVPVAGGRGSLALHLVEVGANLLDLLADEASVRLELALARAPGADAAAGAREVGPQPRQARQVVLERGQLDLQAPLLRLGVAREDVDDQRRSVQHLAVQQLLQAALLVGGQLVVDDEHVEVGGRLLVDKLGGAALAEVPHRVGRAATLEGAAHHRRPGRLGQGGKLVERAAHRPPTVAGIVEADEEGALDGGSQVDHVRSMLPRSVPARSCELAVPTS